MNALRELGSFYGTDKVDHGYIDVYSELFESIKDEKNNVLEIGVWGGASICMWSKYFSNSHIMGMDVPTEIKENTIYPFSVEQSAQLAASLGNVSLFFGDSGSRENFDEMTTYLESITGRKEFDVIIDDGSHFQHDIMVGLGGLFKYLSSGGIYIIEDITPYRDLENGAQWWGHSEESHHVGGFHDDETMLAGSGIDIENSVSYVMEEFDKTGVMNSKFLTEDENTYLTENISSFVIYPAKTDPIKCGSEIVVLHKK
jgi:hypothetical protein